MNIKQFPRHMRASAQYEQSNFEDDGQSRNSISSEDVAFLEKYHVSELRPCTGMRAYIFSLFHGLLISINLVLFVMLWQSNTLLQRPSEVYGPELVYSESFILQSPYFKT